MEEQLKAYLLATLEAQGKPLPDISFEASLIDEGVLDSLLLLDFVLFLERRFGIKIPGEDIIPEHFGSLQAVSHYLRQRYGLGAPQ
jgi:acyl carrier protein